MSPHISIQQPSPYTAATTTITPIDTETPGMGSGTGTCTTATGTNTGTSRASRIGHSLKPRACLSLSWEAFSFGTAIGTAQVLRRLAMWVVLLARVALSLVSIMWGGYGSMLASLVVGIILGVVFFYFVALSLAYIGQARGTRRVLGVGWGRLHFDIALATLAAIHVAVFIGGVFGIDSTAFSAVWIVLSLAIFVLGWIAAKPGML